MAPQSWYMPKASAERLAALVDDVHFAIRLLKRLIMGALASVTGTGPRWKPRPGQLPAWRGVAPRRIRPMLATVRICSG